MPPKSKPSEPKPSTDAGKDAEPQEVPGPTMRPMPAIPPELVIPSILKAVELVALVGLYSTVSQMTLSPVYGSVPAGLYHQRATMGIFLLAWLAKDFIGRYIPTSILSWLPIIAYWIPRYQFILFKQSHELGPFWGPIVTEATTFYPLALISIYAAAEILSKLDLSEYGERVAEIAPAAGSFVVYTGIERLSAYLLPKLMGGSVIMTRVGLQMTLATLYAILFPSRLIIVAVPAILFSATHNIHSPLEQTTAVMNRTLQEKGFMLHARNESLTGYLSVLENYKDGFRVMRCDHSLLGGEWTHTVSNPAARVAEPIYAVFAMLEAVRLVETSVETRLNAQLEKNALVIGLGIGTTPTALIAHGVDTTIVEIDRVVHEYATTYFNLPANHTAVIEDAVSFVDRATAKVPAALSYDYIVHDVFTGGAEPADLFTFEFLRDLKKLLKPEGVIAINYAGDLALPSTGLIVRTIQSAFPSCRIFREDEKVDDGSRIDFTNMVIFCKKTAGPLTFRKPTEADFLGSGARKSFLLPKHEMDVEALTAGSREIMRKGQQHALVKWQKQSAIGHWAIMRTVLPHSIWENW